MNYDVLKEIDTGRPELSEEICNEVNIVLKYEGYIARQQKQVEQFHKLEKKKINIPVVKFKDKKLIFYKYKELKKFES